MGWRRSLAGLAAGYWYWLVVVAVGVVGLSGLTTARGATHLASTCVADERVVMVFSEGHGWRETWLAATNMGEGPASVHYGSPTFWGRSYTMVLAPGQRAAVALSPLIWDKRSSFTVWVWSDTGAVVAAVTSWDKAYQQGVVSPVALVCQ